MKNWHFSQWVSRWRLFSSNIKGIYFGVYSNDHRETMCPYVLVGLGLGLSRSSYFGFDEKTYFGQCTIVFCICTYGFYLIFMYHMGNTFTYLNVCSIAYRSLKKWMFKFEHVLCRRNFLGWSAILAKLIIIDSYKIRLTIFGQKQIYLLVWCLNFFFILPFLHKMEQPPCIPVFQFENVILYFSSLFLL